MQGFAPGRTACAVLKGCSDKREVLRLHQWALVPICRKRAAGTAASEGRLEAATSNNPFAAGKTDTTLSATADEPDILAEAAAMAILAAERLAQLLDYNAERLGPRAGLKVGHGLLLYGASAVFAVCGPCRGNFISCSGMCRTLQAA